ncbi:TauD/TfdA family dioxygenase [Rhodococcus sp. IEGM 1366]|uniref:TauD/TfdA dioxygenase family protein n=1 Tax=Rhodococcus sp. IEGM 1366 TaxID=3082223 RepID=UPI002954B3BE|nr:TauD/TfdA family dioxygenase [Rhodococcus sp. IEGM 1366]MDV8071009.1 TauD/TfdA family dioxygenase [Rhodococcus sp. IEGM 1366]
MPVSGALGAEIPEVDLLDLDSNQLSDIVDVLYRYKVVFFRGADLTAVEYMDLAAKICAINIFSTSRLSGSVEPTCQVITDGPDSPPEADYWHTDVTWVAEPPKCALLHTEVVPERGGDEHIRALDDESFSLGGRFMRHIDGLNDDESRAILELLSRHIEDSRLHCRWRWQPGDLAIWDERSTNKRSAGDRFPHARSIRRVEVAGDRPFFDPAI